MKTNIQQSETVAEANSEAALAAPHGSAYPLSHAEMSHEHNGLITMLSNGSMSNKIVGRLPDGTEIELGVRSYGSNGGHERNKEGDTVRYEGKFAWRCKDAPGALVFWKAYGGKCPKCGQPLESCQAGYW